MTRKTLEDAKKSIYKASTEPGTQEIKGYDLDAPFNLDAFLASFGTSGFQAANLGQAISIAKRMRHARDSHGKKFTLFLGYTSNQVSSGNRELIKYLVQHNMVDVLVTTAGGVEEDIIKVFKPFLQGDFRADGKTLREHGINRTGNIFVPNDRYVAFEQFVRPLLDELTGKNTKPVTLTPSAICKLLGERVAEHESHESSILYWAAKNNIPVFCTAITDGSFGDITFFHQINALNKQEQFVTIDILADNARLNRLAMDAEQTGALIIGSGIVKHQILNANMMREGLDYAIYLNTSPEYDGSDSGAEPEEAKSWGKVGGDANAVKVVCDATISLPLLLMGAFRRE